MATTTLPSMEQEHDPVSDSLSSNIDQESVEIKLDNLAPELLELVLLELCPLDLFVIQRTCKIFRRVIHGSKELQHYMYHWELQPSLDFMTSRDFRPSAALKAGIPQTIGLASDELVRGTIALIFIARHSSDFMALPYRNIRCKESWRDVVHGLLPCQVFGMIPEGEVFPRNDGWAVYCSTIDKPYKEFRTFGELYDALDETYTKYKEQYFGLAIRRETLLR